MYLLLAFFSMLQSITVNRRSRKGFLVALAICMYNYYCVIFFFGIFLLAFVFVEVDLAPRLIFVRRKGTNRGETSSKFLSRISRLFVQIVSSDFSILK